jgi:hypothetical protein
VLDPSPSAPGDAWLEPVVPAVEAAVVASCAHTAVVYIAISDDTPNTATIEGAVRGRVAQLEAKKILRCSMLRHAPYERFILDGTQRRDSEKGIAEIVVQTITQWSVYATSPRQHKV